MITEKEICAFLKEQKMAYNEGSSVWGNRLKAKRKRPVTPSYVFGSVTTAIALWCYVLNMNGDGLTLVATHGREGTINEEGLLCIPWKYIRRITYKKYWDSYELYADTSRGVFGCRIPKRVKGCRWHRKNVKKFMETCRQGAYPANHTK